MKSTLRNLKNDSWMGTLSAPHFQPATFWEHRGLPSIRKCACHLRPRPLWWLSPQALPPSLPTPAWLITFLSFSPLIRSQKKKITLFFVRREYTFHCINFSIAGTWKHLAKGRGEVKEEPRGFVSYALTPQERVCVSAHQEIPSHLPPHSCTEQRVSKRLALLHNLLVTQ